MKQNWISGRLSYALSVWAACITIVFGLLSGKAILVIFLRGALCFVLFGILGYIAGWLIHWAVRPRLAFSNDDEEGEDDGEAVDGI